MATRAYTLAWEQVYTLNRIDLEFDKNNKQEKAVIEAWKEYLDLLGDKDIPKDQWATRRIDLLVELLQKMAIVLDYDFDKTHIKNSTYSPVAHGDLEAEQKALRKGLIEIIEGSRSISMFVTNLQNK